MLTILLRKISGKSYLNCRRKRKSETSFVAKKKSHTQKNFPQEHNLGVGFFVIVVMITQRKKNLEK